MKKTFLLSVLFLTAFAMVTSCVNDDDSHAEATVAFQGVMTDLFYSVESEEQNGDSEGEIESDSQQAEIDENVYDYSQAIKDAFDELGLTGVKSQIEEKAKVSEGSISYAEYVCAMQAAAKIQKKMDDTTVNDIKSTIFKLYESDMLEQGINKPEDIPFTALSVQISYYFSSSNNNPLIFQKDFL